jgi:hypothetical protein
VIGLRLLVLLILLLTLMAGSMAASGHRMFVGQSLTVGISAIYDDGEPAAEASVQVFLNGALYSQNQTDSSGFFRMPLPGTGAGDWRFVISGDGHDEVIQFSIKES